MAKKDENIYVLYPSWNGSNGEFPQGEKNGKKSHNFLFMPTRLQIPIEGLYLKGKLFEESLLDYINRK